MNREEAPSPALDLFWEQADQDGSGEHPLVRELGYRTDVMIRYQQMIEDAVVSGRDDVVRALVEQHQRQARFCERLRDELRRYTRDSH
jgi:hypothetical protein